MIRKRRRGTAIVETSKGILVAAGRHKVFLLPGGGAGKNESRMQAAVRELEEETGLHAHSVKYLFRYLGRVHNAHGGGHFQDHHKVFLVKSYGHCRPRKEVKHIAWYQLGSKIRLSGVTREIIDKYYQNKK
jgi:8-oxo-dGTP diphosphatase